MLEGAKCYRMRMGEGERGRRIEKAVKGAGNIKSNSRGVVCNRW